MPQPQYLVKDTDSLVWGILYSVVFISTMVVLYGTILLGLNYEGHDKPNCITEQFPEVPKKPNYINRDRGVLALKSGLFMLMLSLAFCIIFLIQSTAIQEVPGSFIILTMVLAPIIFMYFQIVYYEKKIKMGHVPQDYNSFMKVFITILIINIVFPLQSYIQNLRRLGIPLSDSSNNNKAITDAKVAGPYLVLTSVLIGIVVMILHIILKFFSTDG